MKPPQRLTRRLPSLCGHDCYRIDSRDLFYLRRQSEKVVQAALDAAAKDRTTIAVAHRLSTIQNADHIFVLKDGKVAERGTHSELIHKGGIYAELVQQQALEKHH